MVLEQLITTYGYWAVLAGTFLEGETILILGGFAAHQGYLALQWVILAAFTGSLCGDQLFFLLGRKYSHRILARIPSLQSRVEKAQKLLERFHTWLVFIYRYMYGFRSVIPFVIGTSVIPAKRFFLLDLIGVLVWAILVGSAGYLFGSTLEVLIGDVKKYAISILGIFAAAWLAVWIIYLVRRKRPKDSSE